MHPLPRHDQLAQMNPCTRAAVDNYQGSKYTILLSESAVIICMRLCEVSVHKREIERERVVGGRAFLIVS